jgi:hypothetical protein
VWGPPVVLADDVAHAVVEGVEVVPVVVREAERGGDVAVEVTLGRPVRGVEADDLVAVVAQPGDGLDHLDTAAASAQRALDSRKPASHAR